MCTNIIRKQRLNSTDKGSYIDNGMNLNDSCVLYKIASLVLLKRMTPVTEHAFKPYLNSMGGILNVTGMMKNKGT